MADSLITLTTDFGEGSPYVAAMKGVLLSINPAVRILDLGHSIPPQNLRHASFFLTESIPYFPEGSLHVVVVDPGVGTGRALLHVSVAGRQLLAPDNGCWSQAAESLGQPTVRRLTDSRYWRETVSSTFHGRDILAPVAAHLSLGLDPTLLGPTISSWNRLPLPSPTVGTDRLLGEVVFVDDFGNLLTNIPGAVFEGFVARGMVRIRLGSAEVTRVVRTYGEAEKGSLVGLVSSSGFLEVALVEGNAAWRLGLELGARVEVLLSRIVMA